MNEVLRQLADCIFVPTKRKRLSPSRMPPSSAPSPSQRCVLLRGRRGTILPNEFGRENLEIVIQLKHWHRQKQCVFDVNLNNLSLNWLQEAYRYYLSGVF